MRKFKFVFVAVVLTVFQFLVYTLFAQVVFCSNELLFLSSALSYLLTTFLAYFLHSRITWKGHKPRKAGVVGFFFWNFLTAFVISPAFTWLFGLIKPLYELVFGIFLNLHLSFSYEVVESTMIFILTMIVVMILNYFFYDRLVFNKPPKWLKKLTQKLT